MIILNYLRLECEILSERLEQANEHKQAGLLSDVNELITGNYVPVFGDKDEDCNCVQTLQEILESCTDSTPELKNIITEIRHVLSNDSDNDDSDNSSHNDDET